MSTMQRGQSGQGSFELGSKKKFGKNLNKLQKPPAPPIANGASQKGSGAARNGLLLLSTKRSSSTGNSQGAGLLSAKSVAAPKPQQSSSIRNESYTSAHDALVDAVRGASRNDIQKEPDAWGVAEKQASTSITYDEPGDETAEATTSGYYGEQEIPQHDVLPNYNDNDFDRSYRPVQDGEQRYDRPEYTERQLYNPYDSEDWNREQHQQEGPPGGSDQGLYMSRLARDRAERRRQEEDERMKEQREGAARRLQELEDKLRSKDSAPDHSTYNAVPAEVAAVDAYVPRENTARTLFDPNTGQRVTTTNTALRQPEGESENNDRAAGPVIQLSSYEDRDRGESTAGPRLLFDPKSGSMVAVNEADKEKKIAQKSSHEKDKTESADVQGNTKSSKKVKSRIDPPTNQKKERPRRGDSVEAVEAKPAKSSRPRPANNRLPRTCGVLFVRDEKGNCYSADGCDGDQGYGCHGVPGGRIRNPVAFAKFQDQLGVSVKHSDDDYLGHDTDQHGEHLLHGYISSGRDEAQEAVVEWVKANEKIELLTGAQDSPTLKATAQPWAPSEAALAAAQEFKEKTTQSSISVDSGLNQSAEEEEDDFEEDHEAFVGLGFDPSNMDSVMSSPSMRDHKTVLEAVDLSSLGLGVPSSEQQSEGRTRNIFAFGSSSTWGSAGGNNASDNWGMLGTTSGIGAGADNQDNPVNASSFLNFTTNNTWGGAGLPSFGAEHGTATD